MDESTDLEVLIGNEFLDHVGLELYRRGLRYYTYFSEADSRLTRTAYGRSLMNILRQLHQHYPARSITEWRQSLMFASTQVDSFMSFASV